VAVFYWAEDLFRKGISLEAILKMQITFKDKARADEKAESARVRWRMSSTF
jgi:hypothetical protein